jgi:hypothetical protein
MKLPYLNKLKTSPLTTVIANATGGDNGSAEIYNYTSYTTARLGARWTLRHRQQGSCQEQKRESKDPDIKRP